MLRNTFRMAELMALFFWKKYTIEITENTY